MDSLSDSCFLRTVPVVEVGEDCTLVVSTVADTGFSLGRTVVALLGVVVVTGACLT